jgi:hypothetical protein
MEWLICDEKDESKPISNFRPEVCSVIMKYINEETEPEVKVRLKLIFADDEESRELIVSISELESTDWLSKNIRCRFHPKTSSIKARRYIADEIRSALPSAKKEYLYYINRFGTHIINGVPLFNTGNDIIWPHGIEEEGRPCVELKPTPFKLAIDKNLTELESVSGMFELMSLSPNSMRVILSQNLLYIMRDVYKSVWKAPCVSVLLYGKTGTKKTSTAALMTQMHNLDKGITHPVRLNSSISAAETLLFEKSDCVKVLDDLFPTEYRNDAKKQEQTFFEITRIIADGVSRAVKNNPNSGKAPTVGVLFTSEYLVGKGSNAARLLPVELFPSPDGEMLKKFQDHPLRISTFYYYFIKWYISNYYEIQDYLKEYREEYQNLEITEHDRLNETHFFLSSAYALLLQYSFNIGYVLEQDVQTLFRSFFRLITALAQEQQLRVNQGASTRQNNVNKSGKSDCLQEFSKLYKSNYLDLADSPRDFYDKDDYDGVVHNDCLCLRTTRFEMIIHSMNLPNNINHMLDVLEAQGALIRGPEKNRRSKQIFAAKGKRFYFIPLNKLK